MAVASPTMATLSTHGHPEPPESNDGRGYPRGTLVHLALLDLSLALKLGCFASKLEAAWWSLFFF